MPRSLVIVESPAKARTIAGYLGDDYVVESSIGHIRDLPRGAKDVPAAYKGEKWARLGVDTDNDFKPLYVVSSDKKDQVRTLKNLLADADELFLATDEDREGEAIAWHLLEVLNPQVPVKRMVFHEITPAAIEAAIEDPRELDRHLVDAQEARRILDRLYGYEVSPVLWRKVSQGLSAGRVQSVATRIVVEREWERMKFVRAGYWSVDGVFAVRETPADGPDEMTAKLVSVDERRIATGRDFDESGTPSAEVLILEETGAQQLVDELTGVEFAVTSRESKPYRRRPAAPFMTSTLQQAGGRQLRMSAQQVMRAAQSLYEQGFITYMRTDSTSLSATALNAARSEVVARFGAEYLPDAPRVYNRKVKNAQEAHEAIRPAGDSFKSPDEVSANVGRAEAAVYDLVWKRTVASQMTDAVGETVTIRIAGLGRSGQEAVFSASGTVIAHTGHQRAYSGEQDEEDEDRRRLPAISEGDRLDPRSFDPEGHTTQPPARYTEASLVKRLEDLGIGRPSTYASIMGTIQDRGYVWKKGSALVPDWKAFAVVNVLVNHFPDLVDYAFTARMEDDLDAIAGGSGESIPWLTRFYFGEDGRDGAGGETTADGGATPSHVAAIGLKDLVSERLDEIDAAAVNSIPIGMDPEGRPIIVKPGKFGPYIQRGVGDDKVTAGVPDELAPDELTIDKALEILEAPTDIRLGTDPVSGLEVLVLKGRFGPYVQLGEFVEGEETPRRASLFQSMTPETVGLEQALDLLRLPRVVGVDPSTMETITAFNGRYGPYLSKKNLAEEGAKADNRTIDSEQLLLDITLEQALQIYSEPKRRRGQVAKPPLRELGNDVASGKPMVLKDGRFGPYVTDGETNASLRKGDTVENITDERASELLQIRRDAPPKKKAAKKKSPAKKKKATAKKAAKKVAKKASTSAVDPK